MSTNVPIAATTGGLISRLATRVWAAAPRALLYSNLIRNKPAVAPRAARQLLEARILRRKVLRGVELAVTYRCQASCPKCSCAKLVDGDRRELELDEIVEVSQRIVEAGAILVNLTGGEPLLRGDIVDLVRAVSAFPWLSSITTNALLATPEMIDRLAAAGLNMMQISLSSPVAEEHDREMGVPGAFVSATAAIRHARRVGITVLINTVITRELLHSWRLEAMAELARQQTCFLSLVFPASVGGWEGTDVALSSQDYRAVKARWLKRGYVTTDTETSYHRGFCPAGSEKIYISPYGDLFPCPFIHSRQGNVREQDIVKLWRTLSAVDQPGCCNVH